MIDCKSIVGVSDGLILVEFWVQSKPRTFGKPLLSVDPLAEHGPCPARYNPSTWRPSEGVKSTGSFVAACINASM